MKFPSMSTHARLLLHLLLHPKQIVLFISTAIVFLLSLSHFFLFSSPPLPDHLRSTPRLIPTFHNHSHAPPPPPPPLPLLLSPPPPPPPPPQPPPPSPPVGVGWSKECDMSRGRWVRDPKAPYYTNRTCWTIQEHQNCMKYGRPDMDFLKWRWKPDACELPVFNPAVFLEIVRGKSLAFVGDSLARNQMQSLMCLLSRVAYPKDVSKTRNEDFKRMYYKTHDFTISIFWSPFLVRATPPDGKNGPDGLYWRLHLDQVDRTWHAHVGEFDYVVISGGNWFTRPSFYYRRRRLIGCNYCQPTSKKVRRLPLTYANQRAFRTAFQAVTTKQKKTKTKTTTTTVILRTPSPSHFEGGKWDAGGRLPADGAAEGGEDGEGGLWMYRDQLRELRNAAAGVGGGGRRRWRFAVMDTTQAMLLRPDGHPSRYGHWPEHRNLSLYNDCVHWCLPGPVDMWNDLLLQVLGDQEYLHKQNTSSTVYF